MASPCKQKRFVSHGGDVWGFARKYNIPLEKVLDFSGPINHLGPAPKAVEAVKENAHLIRFYPDPNPVNLKQELSRYVGHCVTAENMILGNGSIELIYMITELFPRNFKAVIPIPSFTEYEKATLRVHGEPIYVQLPPDFSLNIDDVKKAITDNTRIVSLCNPHSPSGFLYDKKTILDLVEYCQKRNVIVSIDENYIEFTDKGEAATLVGETKTYENLFVIRSVTKFYGMPGIRFGYAIASESLIDALETVRQPWSINGLAECATLAAIKDIQFIEHTKRTIAKEKAQFTQLLNEIKDFKVFPSEASFLLVKILNPKITSTALREELAKEGLLIRDCNTFLGLDNSYFRLTVRSEADNQKLTTALKKIIQKI